MQYWKNLYDQSSHNVVSSSIHLTQGSEENILRIKKNPEAKISMQNPQGRDSDVCTTLSNFCLCACVNVPKKRETLILGEAFISVYSGCVSVASCPFWRNHDITKFF